MKNIFSKVALGAYLFTSLHSCSLDEYNPTMVEADETLSTFEGWKGMQSYCYQALSGYLFNFEFLALCAKFFGNRWKNAKQLIIPIFCCIFTTS